ncbi:hypothetical protein [Streptomyces spiralis]|nr:hypothetical protein [Streptomyces spiralis]
MSLESALSDLAGRGIRAGEIQPGAQQVRFAAVLDPDGNRVTPIENPVT